MRIAICPGSFDPVTVGHLDIVTRASKLFDKVIVLVVKNAEKNPSFTAEERVEMINTVVGDLGNVTADTYEGLLVNYVQQTGACAIVKGLRAVSDFEYEFQMALTNKQLYPEAETVFLTTSGKNLYLSSSLVKQLAYFHGDISKFVPPELHDIIAERLSGNYKKSERE